MLRNLLLISNNKFYSELFSLHTIVTELVSHRCMHNSIERTAYSIRIRKANVTVMK